jgi:hypothetical protein
MTRKDHQQLIDDLEKRLGSISQQNIDVYLKEAAIFQSQGKVDEVSVIRELVAQVAPNEHSVHTERLNDIAKWLDVS